MGSKSYPGWCRCSLQGEEGSLYFTKSKNNEDIFNNVERHAHSKKGDDGWDLIAPLDENSLRHCSTLALSPFGSLRLFEQKTEFHPERQLNKWIQVN